MTFGSRRLAGLTGAVLLATLVSTVPNFSSAAPPAGPGYACSTAASPAANATKIMIAGDSITNASAGDYTWRYWLWHDLVDRGAKVNFVGRFKDTIDANTLVRGNHQYLDCNFDQDHESRPGVKLYNAGSTPSYDKPASSSDATLPSYPGYSSWIRGAVATYKPAIVVAFVGANDVAFPVSQGTKAQVAAKAINYLKTFITQARAGNSGVDIVLTTVPTPGTGTTKYTLYNKSLPGVVSSMTTSASKLVLATMPSWANHTWDGLHPDANGEVAIASAVNAALHKLSPSLPAKPSALQKPRLGPRVAAVLSAASAGAGKVKLTWKLPPGSDRTIIYVRNVTTHGSWVRKADLVLSSLRSYYPKTGTATCQAKHPCTTFTVSGLSGGTTYAFEVRSAKGLAIATDIVSNVKSLKAS